MREPWISSSGIDVFCVTRFPCNVDCKDDDDDDDDDDDGGGAGAGGGGGGDGRAYHNEDDDDDDYVQHDVSGEE